METNDYLLQIQSAVKASAGRVTYGDILDFVFGKPPPVENTAAAATAVEIKNPVDIEESDTDDEAVVDYGPGKVKATEKMWKFLNQMRAAPLTILDEIINSGLYDFTFQTEVNNNKLVKINNNFKIKI